MKTWKHLLIGTGMALLSTFPPADALNLSQYQDILRQKNPPPQTKSAASFLPANPEPKKKTSEARAVQEDADASYKNSQLVTLGGTSNQQKLDGFSLPPDTRIPEGLRPLLADRRYPRQGISMTGYSGSIQIPSPGVLEPGKSAVAIHMMPFDLYGINDQRYDDEAYFDTNVGLVYGAFEGFELGIDKTFSNQDRFGVPEPVFVNCKYQVPGNVTLGGSFSTDSQSAYHSAWISAGVPVLWVGAGVNVGAGEYHFTYSGYDELKRAKFGGYNYKYDTAKGYADPAFFMVGGAIPLNRYLNFSYDFNGDKFSLGLRFNYQNTLYLDAAYLADGDYERLPGAIAHKRIRNFVFGTSISF